MSVIHSEIHYSLSPLPRSLLEEKTKEEQRQCTLDDLHILKRGETRLFLFSFFFLRFSVPIKRSKRRDSIPPLGVINHSFLGASAY